MTDFIMIKGSILIHQGNSVCKFLNTEIQPCEIHTYTTIGRKIQIYE